MYIYECTCHEVIDMYVHVMCIDMYVHVMCIDMYMSCV